MTTTVTRPGSIPVDLVGNTDVTKLSNDEKLQKSAVKRTSREIEFLKRGTEDIKFFKETVAKLGFNTHDLLCQRMYYQFVPADNNLFEAGSLGTTFYIILKGSVGVIVNLPKPGKNELEPTEVAQLPTGSSFGELSLMEAQLKPRAATILCKEDCHFAVLDKKPYQDILGMAEKKKLDLLIDFLLGLDVFKGVGWSRHSMKPVVYLFKYEFLKRGNVLYNEGEKSELVYIVRHGEVKFTKQITINPRSPDEMIVNEKAEVMSYENRPMQKAVELAVIGPNQFFGDDEAFFDIPRQSSAIVNSLEAEIWVIAKKEFFKKLHTFDASYQIFAKQAKAKKQWRDARVREISRTANQKINPDILIGPANKFKNAAHNDTYSKLELKFFNRKQAQEHLAQQATQAEISAQANLVPTLKHLARPTTSIPAKLNNNNGIVYQSEFVDPQLFYHNEFNNTELKAFLEAKIKGQSSEESRSRILYSSHSQVRPASAFCTRRGSQESNMDVTIYQTFAGAYRPNEPEHRQNFQLEHPALSKLLPKGWNPNATYSKYSIVDPERVNTAGSDQLSAQRARIPRSRRGDEYYDAEIIMNQTLETKRKIQQQLQRESFGGSNPKGLFDMDPTFGNFGKPPRYSQANEDQSNAHSLSPKIKQQTLRTHEDAHEDDDGNGARKRISSKEDDHSHKIGDYRDLLKLLPKRVRQAAKPVTASIDSHTAEEVRNNRKELNKSVDFAKLSGGERKVALPSDRMVVASTLPAKRSQSAIPSTRGPRFGVTGTSIQKQDENDTTTRVIKNLRYSSAEATAAKAMAMSKTLEADRTPAKKQEIQRNRLYEYSIVQQYKGRGYIPGRKNLTMEQEKEKVLSVYDKIKTLKLRNRMADRK